MSTTLTVFALFGDRRSELSVDGPQSESYGIHGYEQIDRELTAVAVESARLFSLGDMTPIR